MYRQTLKVEYVPKESKTLPLKRGLKVLRGDNVTSRQRAFIEAYTLRGSETYGNATKSAIKAGYSDKRAGSQGCIMLKNKEISKLIEEKEAETLKKEAGTLETKIKLAWDNYLKAMSDNKPSIAQKWWREHGELSGHYIEKKEISQEVVHKEDVNELIYDYLQENRN